jgi:hypothetical protein
VNRWVHLVTWKLYDVFGLALQPADFIDLDSSNAVKFSRHLIVIISEDSVTDNYLSSDTLPNNYSHNDDKSTEALPRIVGKEFLFRNNIEVGRFVDIVVGDVLLHDCNEGRNSDGSISTAPKDENVCSTPSPSPSVTAAQTAPPSLQLPRWHAHKRPNKPHESFFVWNSERTAKTCFVDLGVYTRNRAFRLLSSCKFGKTSRLRVATPAAAPQEAAVRGATSRGGSCCDRNRAVNYLV